MNDIPEEKNPIKRAWIWFWYSNVTRLLFMLGIHLPLVLFVAYFCGFHGENLRLIAAGGYAFTFLWMVLDNDFNNLNRIGLDVYRKPLHRRDRVEPT